VTCGSGVIRLTIDHIFNILTGAGLYSREKDVCCRGTDGGGGARRKLGSVIIASKSVIDEAQLDNNGTFSSAP
jgi:hypothetical protein